jgi:PadR family transcriptional regulator, regulatory protein AphA
VSRRRDELNTTSYAMLGMLAVRSWTTYELAKQMDRGLGRLWPRARSNLFNEPKKLVSQGLAVASEESTGRRPRTVYTITPAGRQALRVWLGTPGEGPVLEFEQMLKIFFADQGSKADVLAALGHIREWARERQAENLAIARAYLAGDGPFPERAAVLALTGRFLTDFADMVGAWADWADTVVADWPQDPRDARPDWEVFEGIAGTAPRHHTD